MSLSYLESSLFPIVPTLSTNELCFPSAGSKEKHTCWPAPKHMHTAALTPIYPPAKLLSTKCCWVQPQSKASHCCGPRPLGSSWIPCRYRFLPAGDAPPPLRQPVPEKLHPRETRCSSSLLPNLVAPPAAAAPLATIATTNPSLPAPWLQRPPSSLPASPANPSPAH